MAAKGWDALRRGAVYHPADLLSYRDLAEQLKKTVSDARFEDLKRLMSGPDKVRYDVNMFYGQACQAHALRRRYGSSDRDRFRRPAHRGRHEGFGQASADHSCESRLASRGQRHAGELAGAIFAITPYRPMPPSGGILLDNA